MTHADTVFVGGTIFTAGWQASAPAAVAVIDGRIAAIGADEEIRALAGPTTEVVDITGRLLLPGFQDAHVHPILGGVELLQCDLSDAVDAADCIRLVNEYAAANPDAEWILGGGWSMDFFPGGTPTSALLDAVVADRPVLLMNRDHHGSWVNSRALALGGITASTPDPADGRIERDADGNPSGTLHEGATDLLGALRPDADPQMGYQGLLRGQSALLSQGVTGWQDAFVGAGFGLADTLEIYLRAIEEGTLLARTSAALWWERHQGSEQIPALVERRARAAAVGRPELFTASTVKIMVDGVAENFTAAMSMAYLDAHGHATENSGLSFIDREKLKAYVQQLDAEGFQVHFHSLGDRAVTEALDAIESAVAANGPSDNRHHLAHLQVVAATDIPRFAQLGASANIQALWACREPQLIELTFPFLAPELIEQHYPFGSLERAGADLVAGSDWPVSSADPLQAIHVAVNRVAPGRSDEPLGGEHEKLALASALTAYTFGSARICGREESTGRLEVGYLADLVVLDRDPFAGPSEEIGTTAVASTWIDGHRVYSR